MATDKQIAANRANALKSTGPRTPAGKLVASLNNTRHGMLAKSVLLRGESPERFRAMVATYYLHFQPRNAVENGLVDNLVIARWRQMRLATLETAALNLEIDRQSGADAAFDAPTRAHLAFRTLSAEANYMQNMHRHIVRNDRQYSTALDKLLRLKKEQANEKDPNRLAPPGYRDVPEPDFSSGFPLPEEEETESDVDTNPISDAPEDPESESQPEEKESLARESEGIGTGRATTSGPNLKTPFQPKSAAKIRGRKTKSHNSRKFPCI